MLCVGSALRGSSACSVLCACAELFANSLCSVLCACNALRANSDEEVHVVYCGRAVHYVQTVRTVECVQAE